MEKITHVKLYLVHILSKELETSCKLPWNHRESFMYENVQIQSYFRIIQPWELKANDSMKREGNVFYQKGITISRGLINE